MKSQALPTVPGHNKYISPTDPKAFDTNPSEMNTV